MNFFTLYLLPWINSDDAMKKFILLALTMLPCTFNLFSQTSDFVPVYDSMQARFQVYYAFGDWKAIDWAALSG